MANDQNNQQKHGHKGLMGKTPPSDQQEGFSREDELDADSENSDKERAGELLSRTEGTEGKKEDEQTGLPGGSATDAQL